MNKRRDDSGKKATGKEITRMHALLRWTLAILVLSACSACNFGKPAPWAQVLEEKARCGMSIPEVERLAGRDLSVNDNPAGGRGTHQILTGITDVWLQVDNDKLQWLEVNYSVALMKMVSNGRKQLCPATPADAPQLPQRN